MNVCVCVFVYVCMSVWLCVCVTLIRYCWIFPGICHSPFIN